MANAIGCFLCYQTDRQIGIKNTSSLKTLDITGFFGSFQLNCYVFSLVFALISRNKGNFLYLTANYLIEQSCGSTLRLSCRVSVDIHRGTDIRVT